MRKAVLDENNRVIDLQPVAEGEQGFIEAPTTVSIGCFYDPNTSSFLPPPDPPAHQPTAEDVKAERDRRLEGCFTYDGVHYDCDRVSMIRIAGAGALAGFWISQGNDPDSNLWHGEAEPFVWIDHYENAVVLTASQMFGMSMAAADNEQAHILAGRALKEMDPIPLNYADDVWWP